MNPTIKRFLGIGGGIGTLSFMVFSILANLTPSAMRGWDSKGVVEIYTGTITNLNGKCATVDIPPGTQHLNISNLHGESIARAGDKVTVKETVSNASTRLKDMSKGIIDKPTYTASKLDIGFLPAWWRRVFK